MANQCPLGDELQTGSASYDLLNRLAYGIVQAEVVTADYVPWLAIARQGRSHLAPDALAYDGVGDSCSLELDSLFAGVEVEAVIIGREKGSIPELAHIASVPDDTRLIESHLVTTNGDRFAVIDATEVLEINKVADRAKGDELQNLLGKFLGRLAERDALGKPHIFSPDNTTLKAIATTRTGVTINEIRMAGKSRLYVTVNPNTDPAHIVILGSHGNDEGKQQPFINRIKPPRA